MILVVLRNLAVLFDKRVFCAATLLISSPNCLASDTARVDFSAAISDGVCDISLSDTSISFGVHRYSDVVLMSKGKTLRIMPLTASIICSGSNSPELSVMGTTSSSPAIFRDSDSMSSGVGFMLRRDIEGITSETFYDEALAIKVGEPVTLSPVLEAEVNQESFLLGLIRDDGVLSPGLIKASVTFTIFYQ